MTGFYGKAYRYKDKVIGAYTLGSTKLHMIGVYDPKIGGAPKITFPVFRSIDEAQRAIDEFAKRAGLSEVQE